MQDTLVRVIFFTLLLLECFHFKCVAKDTMRFGERLADGETLVSAGQRFVLRFFGSRGRYLGIWYHENTTTLDIPTPVVWVANRDNPIPHDYGVLQIALDGNLKLLDRQSSTSYFSTSGLESSRSSNVKRILKLMDSGNLAFIDAESGRYLWQSFENPTDTFLPGMRMDDQLKLTSWISHDDPGIGKYIFQQNHGDSTKYFIVKQTNRDLQSGIIFPPITLPNYVAALLSNFSKSPDLPRSKFHEIPKNASFVNQLQNFSSYNYSQALSLFSTTRLSMNSSGEIQFYGSVNWDAWLLLWSWSEIYDDPCSVYNPCGNFGFCKNEMGKKTCDCLPGFEPKSIDNRNYGEFPSACERKTPCSKSTNDTFLNLNLTEAGINYTRYAQVSSETECKEKCLGSCECQAYRYSELSGMRRRNCHIWITDLYNIHMDDRSTDSISIRVAVSDIKSTRRDCETCGRYIVPYPLSTNGSICGDPSYSNFFCDKPRDQLQFLTLNGTFDVVNIDKDKNRFVIQASVENADSISCGARYLTAMLQNPSSPFQVIDCKDSSDVEYYRIYITWKPPSEPLCNSSLGCFDWPNSSCEASVEGLRRCLCSHNYQWDGLALKCTPVVVASSKQKRKLIISIIVIVAFLLASSFSYIFFRRTILANRQGSRENILGYPMPYMDDTEMRTQDFVVEDDKVIIDMPFFSFESIQTATDNFSDANKLGRGGFGPVYKGVFPGGKEMAVKRLSSHSGQGTQEFQNEVKLIAKLQHRNLVRLLGYCIRGSEKLLLYEYMINKSLDTFIFDKGRCMLLDWEKRFEIILGITRGLLYLHQDSRLRIIHRDMKTSNVLLDEELNPKISDFGLARIVGGKETEASTQKVVGTFGYMSPEYALEGSFSIKSDVFSFGVILLEIISGKRSIGFYEEVLSLLGYAWKLWQERIPMEFIDKNLLESCKSSASEVLKCINIGLLCVQEDPVDRPTMANVLVMLGSETATLPSPNQPAFISRKRPDSSTSGSSSSKLDSNSINKMTVTAFEGR